MDDYLRGHRIELKAGEWIFCDTGEPTLETWKDRPCGYCGLPNTPEGHDGCLGTLPGVMNACCGHGQIEEAYLQYPDGRCLYGREAIEIMEELTRFQLKNITYELHKPD